MEAKKIHVKLAEGDWCDYIPEGVTERDMDRLFRSEIESLLVRVYGDEYEIVVEHGLQGYSHVTVYGFGECVSVLEVEKTITDEDGIQEMSFDQIRSAITKL